jgi:hypothetical protein
MEHGRIREDGSTTEVLTRYLASVAPMTRTVSPQRAESRNEPAALHQVTLESHEDGVVRGDPISVRFVVETRERLPGLELAMWIMRHDGTRVLDEGLFDDTRLLGVLDEPGSYDVSLRLPGLLPAGEYVLGAWLGSDAGVLLETELLSLRVLPRAEDRAELLTRRRMAGPTGAWRVRPKGDPLGRDGTGA